MNSSTLPRQAESLLSITNLSKSFGSTTVLNNVSLEVLSGEIHGLVGQNGSGKSTLIKCLSGYHSHEMSWCLKVNDLEVTRGLHPGESSHYGICFVHQDLGMLPELSVLENLMMIELANSKSFRIDWKGQSKKAKKIFENFGLDLNPHSDLGTLRPVEQAQVAIIRAVMNLRSQNGQNNGRGILVLDEATTFLDEVGRNGVHSLLRSIVSDGDSVIFVSHDVGEIQKITDRVTILRDGKVVITTDTSSLSHDEIVSFIVGGSPPGKNGTGVDQVIATKTENGNLKFEADNKIVPSQDGSQGVRSLSISDMSGEFISNLSFEIAGGEICGITGIVGSGWEFVLEYIYGSRNAASGSLDAENWHEELSSMSPIKARSNSMVMVPADRLSEGIVAELTLEENIMQPVLNQFFTSGFLKLGRIRAKSISILEHYGIVPKNPILPIGMLSGGNQQKSVIVKWLQTEPRYVLLNQPTQGVDVGARQRIYELVALAAREGAVVLFASSDWEEIVQVSSRVIVMADGHVTADLAKNDISLESIAQAAYEGTRKSADLSQAGKLWGQP